MGLYLMLALATGAPYGVVMAIVVEATGAPGEFLLAAAAWGIPFGVLLAAILGTLHRRSMRKRGLR